jgi:hypothetical protein
MNDEEITARLRAIEAGLKLQSAAFAECSDNLRRSELKGKNEYKKAKEDVQQMFKLGKISEDG